MLKSVLYRLLKLGFLKTQRIHNLLSQRLFLFGLSGKLKFNRDNTTIHRSTLFKLAPNSSVVFEGKNRIGRFCEFTTIKGSKIKIGYRTTIQDRNIIIGDVELGNYCLTAPNVYISSGRHYFDLIPHLYIKDQDDFVSNNKELKLKHSKKVQIDDDVWIGINTVILAGLHIGKGTVIGANSVVTQNIPPYSIVIGQPARIIRKRLSFEAKINLQYLNEYDWPHFYSGVLYRDRQRNIDLGGFLCQRIFVLHLSNDGQNIVLNLKILSQETIRLCYNKQVQNISPLDEFQEIKFPLMNCEYHSFEILCENGGSYKDFLLIKEARIEK